MSAGKGSGRRPQLANDEVVSDNWSRIFGKRKDEKPKLICQRCGVDRFKEPCPGPLHLCPIKGEAQ